MELRLRLASQAPFQRLAHAEILFVLQVFAGWECGLPFRYSGAGKPREYSLCRQGAGGKSHGKLLDFDTSQFASVPAGQVVVDAGRTPGCSSCHNGQFTKHLNVCSSRAILLQPQAPCLDEPGLFLLSRRFADRRSGRISGGADMHDMPCADCERCRSDQKACFIPSRHAHRAGETPVQIA